MLVPFRDALESELGIMRVSTSIKRRCPKCKVIKRHGIVMIICSNPKHKQRQG